MATKPASLPRWADVGGDIVVPASGKRDIGWTSGEKPAAQYMNWFQNLVFQWCDYLDDGDFTGPHTFAGTTVFNGTVETNSTVQMDGAVTCNDDLTITGGAGDTFTCGAEATFSNTVTLPADTSLKHGSRVLTLTPIGSSTANGAFSASGYFLTTGGGADGYFPVPLKIGDRVKEFNISRYGDGASLMEVSLTRYNNGTRTILETSGTFTPAASWGTTTVTMTPEITVAAGDSFWIVWTGGATAMRCGPINVTYDRP